MDGVCQMTTRVSAFFFRVFRPAKYHYLFLEAALNTNSALINRTTMDTREWLGGELDRIRDAVATIPATKIDITPETADAILDKIRGPLTISQEASDWLRTLAPHGPMPWTSHLGWNNNAGAIRLLITPEGTLNLELVNQIGETVWRGEFTPPNYRKAL
jgi:hypothetical protein